MAGLERVFESYNEYNKLVAASGLSGTFMILGNQDLAERIDDFPLVFDGLEFGPTDSQFSNLQDDLGASREAFDKVVSSLDTVESQLKITLGVAAGAAVGVGSIAVGGGVVLSAALAGNTLANTALTAGAGAAWLSFVNAVNENRADDPNASAATIAFQSARDVSGYTDIYTAIWLKNPDTGEVVEMSDFKRGFTVASGYLQLGMTIWTAGNFLSATRIENMASLTVSKNGGLAISAASGDLALNEGVIAGAVGSATVGLGGALGNHTIDAIVYMSGTPKELPPELDSSTRLRDHEITTGKWLENKLGKNSGKRLTNATGTLSTLTPIPIIGSTTTQWADLPEHHRI